MYVHINMEVVSRAMVYKAVGLTESTQQVFREKWTFRDEPWVPTFKQGGGISKGVTRKARGDVKGGCYSKK